MTAFEFKSVARDEILKALNRAVLLLQEEHKNLKAGVDVLTQIAYSCGGDVRKALNILELAAISSNFGEITTETILQLSDKASMKYDKSGDEHHDLLSAFQKSMRGSDQDAAIHYLARLLESGDLSSVCCRLMVCVCEDVGFAHPQAITFVKSCVDITFKSVCLKPAFCWPML